MFLDDKKEGPNGKSVVYYSEFVSRDLQIMFEYLLEREMVYQKDLSRHTKYGELWREARLKLDEVEAHLIWLSNRFQLNRRIRKKHRKRRRRRRR